MMATFPDKAPSSAPPADLFNIWRNDYMLDPNAADKEVGPPLLPFSPAKCSSQVFLRIPSPCTQRTCSASIMWSLPFSCPLWSKGRDQRHLCHDQTAGEGGRG